MSGQYKIMYSSMDQFYDQTNGRMAEWVSQLEPWVKACENLGNMECYQGKSAESVKTYLKEVHMTLLTSIQQAIQLYRTKYLFYREGYYDIEGDLYAVIPQKTLLSVKDRMKTEIEDVSDSSLIVQTSLLNVSDLIALQAPKRRGRRNKIADRRRCGNYRNLGNRRNWRDGNSGCDRRMGYRRIDRSLWGE